MLLNNEHVSFLTFVR